MRARGLIGADGWFTAACRQTKALIETLTDVLAAPAYDILEPDEVDQLVVDLEPLRAVLRCRFARGRRRLDRRPQRYESSTITTGCRIAGSGLVGCGDAVGVAGGPLDQLDAVAVGVGEHGGQEVE